MQPAGPRARGIASLGRGKYVSDSGLAAILSDVKQLFDVSLPASSRQSLKRCRQEGLSSGSLGRPLVQELEITSAGKTHKLTYVHPIATLEHFCSSCPSFASYIKKSLQKYPSSPASPWNIIVYSDEVLPGNNLKHDNKRKLQTVYWSFQQFTHSGLSHDYLWFTLATIRSSRAKEMGGMSVVLAKLLQTFFDEPGGLHITGLNLLLEGEFRTLWAFISTMISDADALKQALEMKGTGGLKLCVCCSNVVCFTSGVAEHDSTGSLVPSSELDLSKMRLHTDQSVIDILEMLSREEGKPNFKQMQTNLGFNLKKEGLILCQHLRAVYRPISTLMFDWMHIYVVSGVWNVEIGALMHKLHQHLHVSSKDMHDFVSSFRWPDSLNQTAKNVFEKRPRKGIDQPLSCSASEALSVYGILRLFLILNVYDRCPELQQACQCYYQLCNVIDLLVAISHSKPVTPSQLQQTIISHLQKFQAVYGLSLWIPKHHLSLHLPWHMQHHGTLYSCFVHERKHKEIKRYGNQLTNTACKFEANILERALFAQTNVLGDASMYPHDDCFLVKPTQAPKSLIIMLEATFGIEAENVMTSRTANVKGMKVSKGDLVVAECDENSSLVGQVEFHCFFERECFTCIQTFSPLGLNFFSRSNSQHVLLPTSYLKHVCTFSVRDDRILVVPP